MKSKRYQIFFKPLELAVLATYLKKRRLLPRRITSIKTNVLYRPGEWNEEQDGIAPMQGTTYDSCKVALRNAVARICLSAVQDSLPQWGTIDQEGHIVRSRTITDPLRLPARVLLPKYLFTINWANSAPGYSWPEAYHATSVPSFKTTIVTLSQDSTEIHGYCDLAIGWFGHEEDPEKEIARIIKAHWLNLSTEYGQQRWVELFSVGEIDSQKAAQWADEIWRLQGVEDAGATLLDCFRNYEAEQKRKVLDKVPYEIPNARARQAVPRPVGKLGVQVYAASPMFWVVERLGFGGYKVQLGTSLGAGDKGCQATAQAVAEFVKHTQHSEKLLSLFKTLGWTDLVKELHQALAQQKPSL